MNRRPSSWLLRLLVAALFLVPPATAAGGVLDPRDPSVAPGDRLDTLVARMQEENGKIGTLEASFQQHRTSSLLAEPADAWGVFSYAAPNRVRWEYTAPDPISLLIDGEEMTTWYRDLQQAERMNVGRQSQKVLKYLGATTSMGTLLEYFDVEMTMPGDPQLPYELHLVPRYARVAKKIRELTVDVHPRLFLPVFLRFVEADGDVTEYRFTDIRLNGEIPSERFELRLPGSVVLREVDLTNRAGH